MTRPGSACGGACAVEARADCKAPSKKCSREFRSTPAWRAWTSNHGAIEFVGGEDGGIRGVAVPGLVQLAAPLEVVVVRPVAHFEEIIPGGAVDLVRSVRTGGGCRVEVVAGGGRGVGIAHQRIGTQPAGEQVPGGVADQQIVPAAAEDV